MELIFTALFIGAVVWFFPAILALFVTACAISLCLIMAVLCWLKETFTPKKKPTK